MTRHLQDHPDKNSEDLQLLIYDTWFIAVSRICSLRFTNDNDLSILYNHKLHRINKYEQQ